MHLDRDLNASLGKLESMYRHGNDKLEKSYHTVKEQLVHSKLIQANRRKMDNYKKK